MLCIIKIKNSKRVPFYFAHQLLSSF